MELDQLQWTLARLQRDYQQNLDRLHSDFSYRVADAQREYQRMQQNIHACRWLN